MVIKIYFFMKCFGTDFCEKAVSIYAPCNSNIEHFYFLARFRDLRFTKSGRRVTIRFKNVFGSKK